MPVAVKATAKRLHFSLERSVHWCQFLLEFCPEEVFSPSDIVRSCQFASERRGFWTALNRFLSFLTLQPHRIGCFYCPYKSLFIAFRLSWNEVPFLNGRICCKMRIGERGCVFPPNLQPTCIQFTYTPRRGAAINGATAGSIQFATDFKVREVCVAQKRIQPKPVEREDIIFLHMTPCSLGDIYQWFGGASSLNLLCRRVSSSSQLAKQPSIEASARLLPVWVLQQ